MGFKLLLMLLLTCVVNYSGGQFGTFRNSFGSSSRGSFGTFGRSSSNNQEPADTDATSPAISTSPVSPASPARSALFSTQGRSRFSTLATSSFSSPSSTADDSSNDSTSDSSEDSSTSEPSTTPPSPTPTSPESPSYTPLARPSYTPPARPSHTPPARPSYTPPARPSYTPPTRTSSTTTSSSPPLDTADADSDSSLSTDDEESEQVSHELKGQTSSSSFFGKSRLNRPSFQRPAAPSSTQSSTPSLTPSSSRSSSRVRPLPTSSRSRLPLTPPSSRSRLPLTPSSSRSSPTPSTSSSAPSSSSGFQPKKSGGFKASFGYRRPSFARTTTESPTTTTTASTTTVTTSTTTTTISTTTIVSTSTTTATPKPSSLSEDNSNESTENDSVKSIPSFLKKKGSGYRFLQKLRDMANASEESDQNEVDTNQSVTDDKPNLVRISSPKEEEKEETRLQSKPSSNFKLLRLTKSKDAKSQAKKRVVNLLKVSETKPTVKNDSNQKDDTEPAKTTSYQKTEAMKADIDEKRIDLKELKKKMSVLKKLRLPTRVVKFNPSNSQSSEDRKKSKNTFSRTTKSPVNNPTRTTKSSVTSTTKSSVRTTTKSSVGTTTKSSTRPSRPPFRISPIRISTPTIKPEEVPDQKRVVSIFSKDTPPVFSSAKSSTQESSSSIKIGGSTDKDIETASTFSDTVKADPIKESRKPGPIFFDRKALKERLRAVVLDAINEDDTSSSIQEKVEKLRDKIVAELPDEAKHHIEKTNTFEEGAARLFTIETDSNIPVSKSESIKPRVRVTTESTIVSSPRSPPTYKPVAAKSPKVIATKTPKIIATTTSPTRVLPTYKPSKISKGNVQNTEDAQDLKTRRIVSLFSGDRTRFGVAVKAKVKDDTKTVKHDDQLEVVEDISAPVISEGRRKKLVSIQVKMPDMNDDMEAMIDEAFTIHNEPDEIPVEKQTKVKHRFNGILKKIRVHASLMDKEAVGIEALTEKVVAKESAAEVTFKKNDSAPQKPKVIKAEQIVVVPLNPIPETAPKVSKKYFNVGPSYVPSYVPAGSRVVGSAVPSDLTGVDTLDGFRSSIPGGSQPIQLKQDVQVEEYEETVVPGSFSSSSRNILKPVLADTARISPETFRNIDDTLVPGSFSSNSDSRYLSPSIDSRDHLQVDIVPGSFSTDARNTEVQGLDFNNPNQQQLSEGNIQDNSLYQVDTLEDEVRYHVNDLGGSVKIPLDDNPRYQENTRYQDGTSYQVEDNTRYQVQDQTRYQGQDDTRYQVQDDTRYQDNLRSLINENLRNQDITRYQVEDNTRYQVDDTPRYQDTTRYQVDDTPRYQVDDSPRYQVDDTPRYQGDTRYQEEDNTRYQVEDNTRYQVEDNKRYQVDDAPRYQDNARYQVEDAPRYQDNTRYQVDDAPRYQVEDNTRYQVDENPRYQDNTRYQVEDNTRYQVDDNPRYQDNTRYQVEDNSRYQVEDNTRYQVEDNTRYQVEDNTRYQVDDAPRYQVEDNTRYQVDDAPRYQDNTRYQVKDSSRVQVDDNPRYQDNTRYQVDDSSQFSPSQFSSSRNSQFSQSPVEYANFDYDEQGNILLLDRSGFPIATVPPGSVLDSSSSFPSDLRSSDVEITPVFISNNRDASRSGKSLGSDYENQLARHQLQIHRILEQQRSFNLG